MKTLIAIIALLAAFPVLAQDMICHDMDTKAIFIVRENVLLDTNEHLIAQETSQGHYESIDEYGKVTYTLHGNNIIMQFDGITKEYTCDL